MVNPDYEPSEKEETVVDVLKEEWRANPKLIQERTELGKGDINTALTNLRAAGWVRRITRGLYEFVDDPRNSDEEQRASAVGEEETAPDVEGELLTMSFTRDLTDRRLEVLAEFFRWLRDRGEPVSKADFVEEFWNDERADKTGYSEGSYWEAFAKAAMKQSDRIEQPNSRNYLWVGES